MHRILIFRAFRARFRTLGFRSVVLLVSAFLLAPGPTLLRAEEPQAKKLSPDQLDALVAPVALYPDPLLAQVLVATTYPLEIIQAGQWLAKNASLKGDDLTKAVQKQEWDPSIQALVLFPDVLKRLGENVKWTTDLGNAFLAQQDDVMVAVQRLRKKAQDSGKLKSTEQQKVETKVIETKTVVEIVPASPDVIYVPAYNPTVIWGPPVYVYPPIYYPPPGAMFFSFTAGVMVGAAISGGWGWGCHWGSNNNININVNNNFIHNNNLKNNTVMGGGGSTWQHDPTHREGTPYGDKTTASKYGGSAKGDSLASRQERARTGGGASSPGSGRTMGGTGSTNRASGGGGDRIGNREIPQSGGSKGQSAFGDAGAGGDRARASSARGASSLGGGKSFAGGHRR
ncbi:MAG: DUF3300 domain-containing protein [Thermoanaerobaculia bacterium]